MNLNGITHIAFACKDYPAMLKFYGETLGLTKLFTMNFNDEIIQRFRTAGFVCESQNGDEYVSYFKVKEKQFIELFNIKYCGDNDVENQGFHHFCLIVEDITEAAKELQAKGISLWRGPRHMNNPITNPYTMIKQGRDGTFTFYIQDPEGNEIEFMQYTENSLQVLHRNM